LPWTNALAYLSGKSAMTKMFYTPFTSMMETIQAQLAAQGTILKSIIESSITLDQ
jgi:GMP synthase PP-ATPase subunit